MCDMLVSARQADVAHFPWASELFFKTGWKLEYILWKCATAHGKKEYELWRIWFKSQKFENFALICPTDSVKAHIQASFLLAEKIKYLNLADKTSSGPNLFWDCVGSASNTLPTSRSHTNLWPELVWFQCALDSFVVRTTMVMLHCKLYVMWAYFELIPYAHSAHTSTVCLQC